MMDPTKTLKRLGSIGLTTAVIAGVSPFLGAVAANAAQTPGTVHLWSPSHVGQVVTPASNGTDSVQRLYADVEQNTAPPLINTVQFTAHDDTADPTNATPPTVIATAPVNAKTAGVDDQGYDSFAVATWSPPTSDTYTVTATGVDANNAKYVSNNSVAVTGAPNSNTVKVTRPSNNSLFGYYSRTSKYNVQGTATAYNDSVTAGDLAANIGVSGVAVTYKDKTNVWGADVSPANGNTTDTPDATHDKSIADIYAKNTNTNTWDDTAGEAYLQALNANNGVAFANGSQFAQACTRYSAGPPVVNDSCNEGTANSPRTPTGSPSNSGRKVYEIDAIDQKGNPISQLPLKVTITDPNNNGSVLVDNVGADGQTLTPQTFTSGAAYTATTDVFGRYRFTVSDSDNEQVSITAQSQFSGTYNSSVDYTVHATFTTAQQNAVSGTATVVGHPTAPLYASQTYGVVTGGGKIQDGPTPSIQVTLKDTNGAPIQGTSVNYQYTRTVAAGTKPNDDTNTYPKTFGPADTGGLSPACAAPDGQTTDANGNVYIKPDQLGAQTICGPGVADAATSEAGNDAFTIYIEKNGQPGYQSGADTLVGSITLSFGPEKLYFTPCNQIPAYEGGPQTACQAQQKAGTDKTIGIFAAIFDGTTNQPIAGRAIDIILDGSSGCANNPQTVPCANTGTGGNVAGTDYGFSPNNNSGLTKKNNTSGDITTDNNGNASVTLFDNHVGTLQVTAGDPTLPAGTASATDTVAFRSYSAVLNGTGNAVGNISQGEVTPFTSAGVGSPGQPLIQGFQFQDQNGAPLKNEVIQVTTNKGFFTDLPNVSGALASLGGPNGLYTKLHFDTPITDGQPVKGDLHSDGTTFTVVTDNSGDGYFNLGILTDPHFATDGTASGTVMAQLNGNGSSQTLDSNAVLFSTDGTTGVQALNPGPMKLVEGYVDTNQVQHVLSTAPSGPRATATKNSIPTDEVDSVIQQTDSFGNRVSEPINVTSTGVGQVSQQGVWGAYNNIDGAPDDSVLEQRTVNESTNPASSSPQTGNQTVTFTWNANKTTGLTNTTTNQTGVNVTSQAVTQSYTVTWYVRDPSKFKYFHKFTPGAKEPAGTPISESVGVFDNANRPVQFLGLEFIRSGPQGQTQDTGNPFTSCNQGTTQGCSNAIFTDQNGVGGFTFISSKTGPYTMTTIVTDLNGNEIGRDHASGELTSGNPNKHRSTTITTATGTFSYQTGTTHALTGAADPGAKVKIYRGGHHVGTTHANANGVWTFTLKFSHSHHYYARSHGDKSNTIKVKVHSKHHHKKHHKKH